MKKNPLKHKNNIETLSDMSEHNAELVAILNRHALICVTDTKGKVLSVNDLFCEVSGYAREEVVGTHYEMFGSGDDSLDDYQEIWDTIFAGETWKGVVCSKFKDGRRFWGNTTVTPVLDEDGRPYKFIAANTDITELKNTQQRLEERTQELQLAQEMTGLCSWQIDFASNTITATDNTYEIYGLDPRQGSLSISRLKQAIHPDDHVQIENVARQLEEKGCYDVMLRLLLPDGRTRHVHVVGMALYEQSGNASRLTGTLQDITPWVELHNKLSESEQLFTIAVDSAGDGVWDCDLTRDVVICSEECVRMLGYPADKIRWDIDEWRLMIHPDDLAVVGAATEQYRSGVTDNFNIQARMRCENGEYKWLAARGKVISRDEHGKPQRLIGIHTDITAIKQQEQDLVAARNEAEKANKAKSEFLSNMSHELRTPLNAIIGFGQLLELEDNFSPEQIEFAHQIVKAGEHLTDLISEILDLAKVEAGRMSLSIESVHLPSLIDDISPLINPLAAEHRISLDFSRIEAFSVNADRVRLKQVLINLVTNAIKYNRDGGSVKLYTQSAGDAKLRIIVEDTGAGIAPNQMEAIFQPFNRLSAEGTCIEGTGIGLTLTKSLVEMMNGSIGVESTPGSGSRFWVEFSLAE